MIGNPIFLHVIKSLNVAIIFFNLFIHHAKKFALYENETLKKVIENPIFLHAIQSLNVAINFFLNLFIHHAKKFALYENGATTQN